MPKSDSDVETLHQAVLDSFDRLHMLVNQSIVLSNLLDDTSQQIHDAVIEYHRLAEQHSHSLHQS